MANDQETVQVRMSSLSRLTLPLCVFLLFGQNVAQGGAYPGPFTGAFWGQGRTCWGDLFVRTRTIEWRAEFFTCQRTTYKIVEKDLHRPFENYDHIVFKLDHVSKGCLFPYIGLYYFKDPYDAGESQFPVEGRAYYDWQIIAYPNLALYQSYPYRKFLDGTAWPDRDKVLICATPFSLKPFPFGEPLFGP